MRPLELVLEGFRSHADRHVFQWKDKRLLAIVGPIGSGKSSILDGIAFALFAKTPVFGKDRAVLINQRKEHMRVELAFEAGGRCWRAIRVIRRKGPAKHILQRYKNGDPSGEHEVVAEQASAVNAEISDLLGLNFEAFGRSVLLAQGRFAEFLHATSGDRDHVLKGLFGFDRVDQMRDRARQKANDAKVKGEQFQFRLDELEKDRTQLATDEQNYERVQQTVARFAAARPQIEEFKDRLIAIGQQRSKQRELAAQLEAVEQDLPAEKSVQAVTKEVAESEEKLTAARSAFAQKRSLVEQTKRDLQQTKEQVGDQQTLRKASELLKERSFELKNRKEREARTRALQEEQEQARHAVVQATERVAIQQKEQETATRAAGEAKDALQHQQQLHAEVVQAVGTRDDLAQHRKRLEEISRLKATAAAHTQAMHTAQAKREERRQGLPELKAARDAAQDKVDLAKKRHDEATTASEAATARLAQLEVAREAAGNRTLLTQQREALNALRIAEDTLEKARKEHALVVARGKEVAAVLIEAQELALQARQEAESATATQTEESETLDDLSQEVHRLEHQEMALTLRSGLAVDAPCPVCEQDVAEIPAVGTSPNVQQARAAVEKQTIALQQARRAETEAMKRVAAAESSVTEREQAASESNAQVERSRVQLEEGRRSIAAQRQGLHQALGEGELETLWAQADQRLTDAEGSVEAGKDAKRAAVEAEKDSEHRLQLAQKDHAGHAERLQLREAEIKELGEQLAELEAKVTDLEQKVAALQKDTLSEEQITGAEKNLDQADAELKAADQLKSDADQALTGAKHAVELATTSLASAQKDVAALEKRREEFEEQAQQSQQQITELEQQAATILGDGDLPELLAQAEAALKRATDALEQAEAATSQASEFVETARRADETARKTREKASRQLAGTLARLGVQQGADEEDLLALYQAAQQAIGQQRKAMDEELTRLANDRRAVDEQRVAVLASLGMQPTGDFHQAAEDARVAERGLAQTIGERKERLEQGAALKKDTREARKQFTRYDTLASDFSANRFVGYLLQEERAALTALGSERFELLTGGRYRFAGDGSFEILDLNNAEQRRDAKTLSGGETFLAALALALALAERVARSGGSLDAFFLDEGFGSLDPPHLELAMDGIERLVADSPNRLVALVSHVAALRNRIDDLIVLDKDAVTGDTVVRSGAH